MFQILNLNLQITVFKEAKLECYWNQILLIHSIICLFISVCMYYDEQMHFRTCMEATGQSTEESFYTM